MVFRDSTAAKTYRETIALPEQDFASEGELLVYMASFWPYDFFAKQPRPRPQDKHSQAKAIRKVEKNITGQVTAGAP